LGSVAPQINFQRRKPIRNMDKQARKWQITINNPLQRDLSHSNIKILLEELKSLEYWCMSDEIGRNSTHHTHIYIVCSSAIRFSTLKKKLPIAHLEIARGTSQENRDYIFKEGKWEKDKKQETNLQDTHEEWGELPVERQGARNDYADLYDLIKDGYSNFDILEENPEFLNQIERIDKVRQTVLSEKYKNEYRYLTATYIHGETGSGKTRSVMERYGYGNVFRVTNYQHPFDQYQMQDVIMFEEFRSSLKIADMLIYLDGYPTALPCRYSDRIACYTNVYLVSNVDLFSQYADIQKEHPKTWKAFLRRINKVIVFDKGSETEYTVEKYLQRINEFRKISDNDNVPFEKGVCADGQSTLFR